MVRFRECASEDYVKKHGPTRTEFGAWALSVYFYLCQQQRLEEILDASAQEYAIFYVSLSYLTSSFMIHDHKDHKGISLCNVYKDN